MPTWQAAIQRLRQLTSTDERSVDDDSARSTSALVEFIQAKQLLDQTIAIIEAAEHDEQQHVHDG